jgi:hypothetical protein
VGAFVAALVWAQPLAAQTGTRTMTTNLVAAVVNGLTVLVDRNLDYGTVIANSGSYAVNPTSANVGKVRIYAEKARSVITRLTTGPSPDGSYLLHTDGTHQLPWNFQASYNTTADNGATSTPFTGTAPYTASLKPMVGAGNTRFAYIYLYGSINTAGVTTYGTYQGVVTISVTY